MRHKQRPVKSSRHKSVTFIIDSHTSFGDHNVSSIRAKESAQAQRQQQQPQQSTTNNNNNHFRSPYQPPPLSPKPAHARSQRSLQQPLYFGTGGSGSNMATGSSHRSTSPSQFIGNSTNKALALADEGHPLLRKQFEHNYRHMSDVMRLAFLENNDLPIDDCSDIDFNSLSTASILQRNIQQQLLQERRNQLQMRQKHYQQLQHQLQHSRNLQHLHDQHHHHNNHHQQHHSMQNDPLDDDYDDNNYEMSDSKIFATATPAFSNSHNQTSASNSNSFRPVEQAGVSGASGQQRHNVGERPGGGKKRTSKTPIIHDESFPSDHQEDSIQNYGEGFFCDEPGCGKSFPSLRKLRHHKVVHSDEFPYVCEFNGCAKKFKRKFGIDLHSTTHFDLDPDMYSKTSNNSSLPFFGRRMQYSMCKPCNEKFKTVHEYQYHMLKHGKEPFKCPVKGCGQTFSIWKSFQKHRASHYFNYYCKMDPSRCDHHTSNLQLLKLHIYCCHFQRKLPENATLASRDSAIEEAGPDESMDIGSALPDEEQPSQSESIVGVENSSSLAEETPQKSAESTPRRDSRLRKNPPRFSTYGQLDYASINNGSGFAKAIAAAASPLKRTRASAISQISSSQSSTPREKKIKLATKVSPKKSGQQQQQHEQHEEYQDQIYDQNHQEDDAMLDESYTDNNDSYEISDSKIFATATPAISNSHNRTSSSNSNSFRPVEQAGVSGQQRHNVGERPGGGKKRTGKTPIIHDDSFPDEHPEETTQNYDEGYFCDEPGCGKSFPSLRKLRHHKVVHSDEFPYICEFNGCTKKFKRKFGIDLHSTTHFDLDPDMYSKTSNNSSLPFFGRRMQYSMCKPCNEKFKTVHEYQYHMLKHGKEPFKCPVKGCGQTFSIWKSFQKHRASHYFNYYCKMDPSRCDHHTSNLQLLKLHIYCCHFQRKLPENATLASRDSAIEEAGPDESMEITENEEQPSQSEQPEEDISMTEAIEAQIKLEAPATPTPVPPTPRRDSRLRKNPPRFSTYGQLDYASINNGSGFAKAIAAASSMRRTRASGSSQIAANQSITPRDTKKSKQPIKVLPKRSAQRLPMSLIADDASTEEDGHSSEGESSLHNDKEEDDCETDPAKRNKFKCHLCDYKFSVRFQLTKHLSTHLELTPEMYSATADKQVVQLSERRRREFYCDKCTVKFECMQDLDNHMRKHGQRPYVCSFCQVPSTFRMAKQYLSHLYEHRFNYKCTMATDCDFTINRKDALKLHIFRMHLNQQLPSYIENFANMLSPAHHSTY